MRTPERVRQDPGIGSRFLRGVLRTFLAVVILGPALVVFVFAAAKPASRIARENTHASSAARAGSASGGETLRRLRVDASFWKARLDLSNKDAVSLAIDLIDSTATLDIRGVPVKTCKILEIDATNALRFLKKRDGFRERLSKPLIVRRETATLPKEPIRVEIAPKDTTEAAKAATRPLAPEEADVYVTMYFDHNLAIAMRQIEKPSTRSGSWRRRWMDTKDNLRQAGTALWDLVRSELPQHDLRIEVTFTRDDAKAIYRALGPEARVALRL
jgi:hypothetical protein